MMTELEFSKERYRQFLVMMPYLVAEARAKARSKAEEEALIDGLLDRILAQRTEIKRQENLKK